MYRLSPIIVGCALSSSRFSWFAHAHLISNNSWLRLIVFAFQLVIHAPHISNNSWLCLIVFAFQLVCPCTAYRQQLLAAPCRLRVSVGLPIHRLSPIILSYAHRLRVSVGLPMHRLSPIIHGRVESSSRFSWFAHVYLIACNSCPNQYKYSPMPYA